MAAAKGKSPIHLNPKNKGALHESLGIEADKKIPAGDLSKIVNAKKGAKVNINGKSITVTGQLKKRANFAKNAKNWHH